MIKNQDAAKDDAIEEVIAEKNEQMTAHVETVKSNILKALNKKEGVDYFGVNKPRTTPHADEFAEFISIKDQKAHRKLRKLYHEITLTQDQISVGVKQTVITIVG